MSRSYLNAQLRIQVRQPLVHEEDRGLADNRAAHRDSLALPAGEGAWLPPEIRLQVEDPRSFVHTAADLVLRELCELQRKRNVVANAHVRVERVVLEHHRDVAALWREIVYDAIADPHDAVSDVLEAGDHPQRGGLAATRRADQDHELAVRDLEIGLATASRPSPYDFETPSNVTLAIDHSSKSPLTRSRPDPQHAWTLAGGARRECHPEGSASRSQVRGALDPTNSTCVIGTWCWPSFSRSDVITTVRPLGQARKVA